VGHASRGGVTPATPNRLKYDPARMLTGVRFPHGPLLAFQLNLLQKLLFWGVTNVCGRGNWLKNLARF